MDARDIVEEAGMSSRPEFYSGRGAVIDDLTSQKLEKMYDHINREYGPDAAQQFGQMVADIPVLSATEFLLTLYQLEKNNWRWEKSFLGDGKSIDVGPDNGDGVREMIAHVTVLSVLDRTFGQNSGRDDTRAIRNPFLREHGIKIPEQDSRNGYSPTGLWKY